MTLTDDALEQLDALLADYATLSAQQTIATWKREPTLVLTHRLLAAIQRLTVPDSSYARVAARQEDSRVHSFTRLSELAATAIALREDIAAGWLASVVELVHASTSSDYLEMARDLHGQGYKDAAAVIAGTSLEVHLKALATKYGLGLQLPNGRPKKMDVLNAELKAVAAYNTNEQKQVTAWLGVRNSAAHGEYGDYDEGVVGSLIQGVDSFTARYPA